jgi:N-formylglutamate amidohydrolase
MGATLLCALFPRSYVDLNRSPDDIDPSMLQGEWPHRTNPSEKAKLGIGLIPSREPGGVVYDRLLGVEEVCRRIDTYYWPYHRELEQALDRAQQLAGVFWHVNCHSMPAVSTSVSPEGPGVPRPDFCLGTRDGTTCDSEFAGLIASCIANFGYSVTIDDPYKGVELVRRYSDPLLGRNSLQIEINRGLYMDEVRITRHAGFATLKANITGLVEVICDYARARVEARQC